MTSEEQADARQRIEVCIKAAHAIEISEHSPSQSSLENHVRAKQIQKQLAVVAKLLAGPAVPKPDEWSDLGNGEFAAPSLKPKKDDEA